MYGILREEREQACDNLVLSRGFEQINYAEHLFDIACSLKARCQGSAMAMAAKSKLEDRVRFITASDKDRTPMTPVIALVCTTSFCLFALGLGGFRALGSIEAEAAPVTSGSIGQHDGGPSVLKVAKAAYGFVAGERYVYDVQIQFGLDGEKSIRKGQITYTATKVDQNGFTLKQSGRLQQVGAFPKIGFGNPFLNFGSTDVTIRYSMNGDELERLGGDGGRSIIGDLPTLIVVPLKDKASWTAKNKLDVSYSDSSRSLMPFGHAMSSPFNRPSIRRLKASESFKYGLSLKPDGTRALSESYQLARLEKSGEYPLFAANYEGSSIIDAAGIPESLSLLGNLDSAKSGQTESTPFRITVLLISHEELARRDRSQKEYLRQAKLGVKSLAYLIMQIRNHLRKSS